MVRTVQTLHPRDGQQVGAYTVDPGPHTDKHPAELLDIRFAGGIVYDGRTFCKHRCHEDIGRTGHRSFIQKHITAFQPRSRRNVEIICLLLLVIMDGCTEIQHAGYMGVHPAPADLVASRLREIRLSESGEQRACEHHRTAKGGTFPHELRTLHVRSVYIVSLESVGSLFQS